jgi:signal transduction histidine kinase
MDNLANSGNSSKVLTKGTSSPSGQEQAALRRVANLVAAGAHPDEVLDAVTVELRRLFQVESAVLVRFDDDGLSTLMAHSLAEGTPLPAGTRLPVNETSASSELRRTRRPARRDGVPGLPDRIGPLAEADRAIGIIGGAKAPIMVEGRVWGYAGITWRQPPAAGIEARMVQFTELAETAIANADSRAHLDASRAQLAEVAAEQAALRRVATLVAEGGSPADVFELVATQMRQLLDIDLAVLERFEADGTATVIAISDPLGRITGYQVGTSLPNDSNNLASTVRNTGRTSRIDNYQGVTGPEAAELRKKGFVSSIGAPVIVQGRLWGAAAIVRRRPIPDDTESRLTQFMELVGTAIANADSRAQLEASRARVVSAADHAQRRIERNLHDGVQQQLIALILDLRELEAVSPGPNGEVARIASRLGVVLEDLREISRGLQPPVLRLGGLGPALRTLARRSRIPVQLRSGVHGRLPERVEIAAYHLVAESFANAARYSDASTIRVKAQVRGNVLQLSVRDDGLGGADPGEGTGLIGLKDRVEAIGGTLTVHSPPGQGTTVDAAIPLNSAPG